jgi:membrane-associated phospholipid phosphatase
MHILLPPLGLAICAAFIFVAGLDADVFIAANTAAQCLPPFLWAGITNLGSTLGAICLFAPVLIRWPHLTAAAALAAPFAAGLTHLIKYLAERPRPAAALPPDAIHIIDSTLRANSFPSGHTLTAFMLAGIVVLCSRRPIYWLALPAAAIVAFSRIAVGAHWPLDLLIGAAGGWLCAALGRTLATQWRFWEHARGQRILAVATLICAVAFTFENTGYPRGVWMQMLLCAIGAVAALYALWRPAALRPQKTP